MFLKNISLIASRRLQDFNRTCNRESGRQQRQVTKQWWNIFEWTTAASRWKWLFEGRTAAQRRWLGEGMMVAVVRMNDGGGTTRWLDGGEGRGRSCES
ncbi:hypothetical protein HN873_025965 [Arachis hypogaea]